MLIGGYVLFREFIRTSVFEKSWQEAGLSEEDILGLELELSANPEAGDVIPGTGGIRKLRYALPNQGKRGGLRIIYIDFVIHEKIYLLAAYAKNEKVNLTPAECKKLKLITEKIQKTLEEDKNNELFRRLGKKS
jgi:hypothetical protein